MKACRLCAGKLASFFSNTHGNWLCCTGCGCILRDESEWPDSADEKARYDLHRNNKDDYGYLKFIAPILQAAEKDFKPGTHEGLDYGSGPEPVLSEKLRDFGFNMNCYDPFYSPQPEVLEKEYDFITCCEVMEHFRNPRFEFERLAALLKPGGMLYCKTALYENTIAFADWYYKNDPTHLFFYTRSGLAYIQKRFGFLEISVSPELIVFRKEQPSR